MGVGVVLLGCVKGRGGSGTALMSRAGERCERSRGEMALDVASQKPYVTRGVDRVSRPCVDQRLRQRHHHTCKSKALQIRHVGR